MKPRYSLPLNHCCKISFLKNLSPYLSVEIKRQKREKQWFLHEKTTTNNLINNLLLTVRSSFEKTISLKPPPPAPPPTLCSLLVDRSFGWNEANCGDWPWRGGFYIHWINTHTRTYIQHTHTHTHHTHTHTHTHTRTHTHHTHAEFYALYFSWANGSLLFIQNFFLILSSTNKVAQRRIKNWTWFFKSFLKVNTASKLGEKASNANWNILQINLICL